MVARYAAILAWPFWPGASHAEGVFKIAVMSMALALFYLFAAEWQFPGGAGGFALYTKALLEGGSQPGLALRDIGYPLVMLLGGYGFTHSFIGVLAVHVLLAWSIPVAACATFGREYRNVGYYTAVVVALSMTPYLFLKFIHHDLAYVSFSVLALCLLVEYLHRGRVGMLYGFLAALIATCLTRPAGNLLFLPLLALVWVFRPAQWRHYLVTVVIFAAVLAAYAVHRDRLLGRTPEGNQPSYFGQQIFYNAYVNSADYGIAITPALGPATARLFDAVREAVKEHPLDSQNMNAWYQAHRLPEAAKEFWFTRYVGQDDERFVASIFEHPGNDRFEYLCLIERNDSLFRDAALEIFRAHPLYPFEYGLRNLAIFLWKPGMTHGRMGITYESFVPEGLYFLPAGRSVAEGEAEFSIDPPARYELRQSGSRVLRRPLSQIEKKWKSLYHGTNQVAVALAAVALIAAIFVGGRFRLLVVVTAAFLFYNAAITAVFAEPNYRYHFFVFPIVLILAGAGVIALLRWLLRWLSRNNPDLGKRVQLVPEMLSLAGAGVIALLCWLLGLLIVAGAGLIALLCGFLSLLLFSSPGKQAEASSASDKWVKALGLALCSAAVFAGWAFYTWGSGASPGAVPSL